MSLVSPQLGYRGDAGHDGVWGRLRGSPQPRHHRGRGQRGQVPLEKGEGNLWHSRCEDEDVLRQGTLEGQTI